MNGWQSGVDSWSLACCHNLVPDTPKSLGRHARRRVAVTGNGVLADTFFSGEMLSEKGSDQRCKRRHELPPLAKFSHRAAIFAKSAGVASRYQVCAAAHTW